MVTTEDILRLVDSIDLPVPASKLQVDAPFITQGLDSLDVATLILAVESKYKKAIPPEQATQMRTIKDILVFLNT